MAHGTHQPCNRTDYVQSAKINVDKNMYYTRALSDLSYFYRNIHEM